MQSGDHTGTDVMVKLYPRRRQTNAWYIYISDNANNMVFGRVRVPTIIDGDYRVDNAMTHMVAGYMKDAWREAVLNEAVELRKQKEKHTWTYTNR